MHSSSGKNMNLNIQMHAVESAIVYFLCYSLRISDLSNFFNGVGALDYVVAAGASIWQKPWFPPHSTRELFLLVLVEQKLIYTHIYLYKIII